MKTVLIIIPARAGSQRLAGKNLQLLLGKPLIQWTIDAARKSNVSEYVIVSTEDDEIANVSLKLGALVPFKRPNALASNRTTTIEVVIHAVEYYQNINRYFDYVLVLQPTSPLRSKHHIIEALKLMNNKKADAVISVCPTEHSPIWCNTIDENGSLEHFLDKKYSNARSQDLPAYYRLNGAIYLVKTERLLDEKTLFIKDNIYAYQMTSIDSVDIDHHLDFLLAETILKNEY